MNVIPQPYEPTASTSEGSILFNFVFNCVCIELLNVFVNQQIVIVKNTNNNSTCS